MTERRLYVPRFEQPPDSEVVLEFAGDVPPQDRPSLRVRLAWILRHIATRLDGKPSCTLMLHSNPPLSKEELKRVIEQGLALMRHLLKELSRHNAENMALERYNKNRTNSGKEDA